MNTYRLKNHRLRLFGQVLPTWLLAAALIASTAGAATGIVLAGAMGGTVATTVDQAVVLAADPTVSPSTASYAKKSDDGTSFLVGKELYQGDQYTIALNLTNRSGAAAEMMLKLDIPQGITVSVVAANQAASIVRVGLGSWVFTQSNALPDTGNDLTITVAVSDIAAPGFYQMRGEIKQFSP